MIKDYLTEDTLTEKSLSRVYDKFEKFPSGAITAYRSEFTRKENKARNKVLMAKLLTFGYDVVSVKGSYIEDFGSDKQQEIGEISFIVSDESGHPKALHKDLIKLGIKFDQDSVLLSTPGTDPILYGTSKRKNAWPSYGQSEKLGGFKGGKGKKFFSRIKGRKFTFEDTEIIVRPQGFFGCWGMSLLAEKNWKDITEILPEDD